MIGLEWTAVVVPVLSAVAVLLVPGLVATAPLRLGLFPRVALSSLFGVVLLGVAGVLSGLLGMAFAAWQPLVLGLLALGVVWLLRQRLDPGIRPERVRWWWLLVSWLAAAAIIAVVAFAAVPSPERISQTYDNVFHLSAIAHILESGDASSLTLRTRIESDRAWSFYPAGWHSLVAATAQVTGASVPVAVNASWIAVAAAVWLPGGVWLSQVLLRRFEPGRVALIALPLGTAFAAMPYGLLTWGTLYPTFLATALLPAAVAVVVCAWAPRAGGRRGPSFPAAALGVALAVAAIGFSQPRVLVSWAVLLLPWAAAVVVGSYRRARRAGGRAAILARRALWAAAAVLVAGAAMGFAYLVFRLGLFERPLEDRLSGPQAQASQSIPEGLWQVFAQSWPLGVGATVAVPALGVAAAVLVGLVRAARTPGLRWVVVAYGIFAVLFALAAGSDDVVTKLLTALWYKDRYRLSSVLPVLGIALATLGVLTAARVLRKPRAVRIGAIAAAWICVGTAVPAFAGVASTTSYVFRLPERAASSEVVSQAQIDFMGEIAQTVPADQLLLGDPWDGSALSGLYADREPVFPHVNGQWDPARQVIAWSLPLIDSDPAVCEALDSLRVRYVLYHPHEFGGGDPAGNHFVGVHRAVEAGLFTQVTTDGDSTLYRIDQCGPLVQ